MFCWLPNKAGLCVRPCDVSVLREEEGRVDPEVLRASPEESMVVLDEGVVEADLGFSVEPEDVPLKLYD